MAEYLNHESWDVIKEVRYLQRARDVERPVASRGLGP